MFGNPWRRWLGQLIRKSQTQGSAKRRVTKAYRFALEPMEDRIVPNTVTVTDNSDNPNDTDSLRYILDNAVSGETIDFAPSVRTIDLLGSGLTINTGVSITNDQGIGPVTIDGDGFTVFTNQASQSVSLTGLTIMGGAGNDGGGICNFGTLMIDDCTITDNSAADYGGGIYNNTEYSSAGVLAINDSTISNNSAAQWGGGIFNGYAISIDNTTISGNQVSNSSPGVSGYGGGIFNNNILSIDNCTFSGNSINAVYSYPDNTVSFGGGIYDSGSSDPGVFQNSTVTGNTVAIADGGSATGGGIYNANGTPILLGDIVASNTAENDGDIAGNVSSGSEDNLIGTGGSGGLTNGTNGNQVGVSLADVGLSSSGLANNGGPMETIAIEPGSYAIGTGVTEANATTDERGVARPIGIPSDVGAFQLSSAPLVTTNPTNVTIDPGTTTANFTAAASGYPTPTVQWQLSTNGGINFYNIDNGGDYSGATTDTLDITGITEVMTGYEYQAVFSNTLAGASSPSTATSLDATLTVDYASSVTGNPTSQTIDAGSNTSFTAAATGNPLPTVQWQVSTNGGNNFSDVSNGGGYGGATSDTLDISDATAAMNGYLYQAVFTNTLYGASFPSTATTTSATLTVDSAPSISTNPTSLTINAGNSTSFSAAATGNPTPTVQWQVSTNGGDTFTNVNNAGVYSGVTTNTLLITDATAAMNGYLYQAVFSNTLFSEGYPSTATTTAATLTVDYAPTVTVNPTNQSINASGNSDFDAAASGNPTPTVQWQVSTDGGITFNNITNGGGYSGATTDILSIAGATAAMNGYLYQTVFTNTLLDAESSSTAVTAQAFLTVDSAPSITANPTNQTIDAGNNTSFTAAGTGYPAPSVQWQVSTNGGITYTNVSNGGVYSGVTTDTLLILDATAAMNGYLYQAVFSNTIVGESSPSIATSTAATLTVDYASTVTTNPTNAVVNAGSNASFTAAASGNPTPTVQWQVSTDGGNTFTNVLDGGIYSGATTDTLTITVVTASMNEYLYQAIFSNTLFDAGSPSTATTTAASLTVNYLPSITSDPTSQMIEAGANISFTASATGNPAPTVQWQVSANGGNTFTNVNNGGVYSDATTDILEITGATASMNGYLYQAVFSNTLFGETSPSTASTTVATLTVDFDPIVTTNPTNATVNAGSNTSFTAAAIGNPSPTVQWQVSTDGGNTFSDVIDGSIYSGAATDNLNIAGATTAMNGYLYQAEFTNTLFDADSPVTTTSTVATLTVDSAPSVTTDPIDQTINAGGNASFTVGATGNPAPTVQWQVSTDGGNTFTNISDSGVYSGANTDTLEITAATTSMNDCDYQAVFSNTLFGETSPSTTTSTTASLTVDFAPTVTTNPTNITVNTGGSSTFTAAAIGNPTASVQWQVSIDGGNTFTDISDGGVYSGTTTDTMAIADATAAMNGYLYQAVFSNTLIGAGSPSPAATTAATLTVDYAPTVTTNPESQTVNAGGNTTMNAAATGLPAPSVQWQVSTNEGSTFTNITDGGVYSGATSGTLTITGATAAMSGYEYQAVFSNTLVGDSSPSTATTSAATLTVDSAPNVMTNPTSTTINVGDNTTFTVSASGDPTPSVQWQVSTDGGNTFTNVTNSGVYSGANSDTLSISVATSSMNGYLYQAIFSNTLLNASGTSTASTTAALLTVEYGPSVTTDPDSQTIDAGSNVSLIAAAAGNPTPSVQWQVSTDDGSTFTNISNGGFYSGATTDTLNITGATASMNGYEYQAIFSNILIGDSSPSTATTTAATLIIDTAPTITSNPTNDSVYVGNGTTLSAAASGYPLPSVQWQVSTNGGSTFTDINDGGVYSGATTGILTISGTQVAMNGYQYQAIFTNSSGSATTSAAILTVDYPGVPSTSSVSLTNSTVVAGTTIEVTLQAKDSEGDDVTTGGLAVEFGLANQNSGGQGTFTEVTDNGNGTYSAYFTGSLAGTNTITATIGGATVTTPMPSITVTPGQISLSHSTLNVLLQSVQLGGETTIVLQGEDAYGNKETSGGQTVDFELVSKTGGYGSISSVLDNQNGTYTATFIGTVDGSNTIEATIGGETISSTANLGVTGSAISLANSIITVPAPGSVQSGNSIAVTLQVDYGKNEKETSGGLNVTFGLASASGGQGTFGPVSYIGNGQYTAMFTGTLAGSNTFTATINGSRVTTKAAAIKVTAGTLSLANSLVTLSSSTVKAGSAVTIIFQPRDAAGNKLIVKGLVINFTPGSNGTAQGVFGKPVFNKNGTYTATFSGTLVGGNTISTSVNGQPLTSTQPTITVIPGLASSTKSTVSVSKQSTQSGSEVTVTLQAEDLDGNLEATGLAIAFMLGSGSGKGTFGKVTYMGNGIYQATFTPTTVGNDKIEALIGGVKVKSMASLTVTPES